MHLNRALIPINFLHAFVNNENHNKCRKSINCKPKPPENRFKRRQRYQPLQHKVLLQNNSSVLFSSHFLRNKDVFIDVFGAVKEAYKMQLLKTSRCRLFYPRKILQACTRHDCPEND